ncbi:SDR family oxidoreductase [Paucihalobacter ruber]|uniref:SDR family oxidoreductase n=1 Tax=Paucihalobacter ruber TaxID=2567861 RepID=A0A506PRK9_9FLAO|nr:SDR family oxidoreductase [Paucihalobacter ruber]TPV34860.1 SDR family oxidoreductase [Paucihalobacter ruber]
MVKEFEHKNYWALILGGGSGLGLASAKKLAQHGMNICVLYRAPRNMEHAIQKEFESIKKIGVDFLSFNADALNPKNRVEIIHQLKAKMANNGSVKTLVHSIAKGNLKPMTHTENPTLKTDDFLLTINAMAISLYDWTKAVLDSKLFHNDARIISFTSEGNIKAWHGYAAVSAAKTSLEAITRSMALELAPFGIKANCIQAGTTNTPSFRAIPGSEALEKMAVQRNPFNKLTTPEDVANVVYLLSKDEAAWINGSIITVDGGEHLR